MTAPRKTVIVVGGPTASGKSGLALDLNGTVINADSMQVYRGLPLLTAQPSASDLARAPHKLYGFLDPAEICSAARWRKLALAEIEAAARPIIVGGTGFYIKALLDGLSPIPDIPESFRAEAIARQKELGNPHFHAELARRDPDTAARLDPLNTQRNVRAWEVLAATGKGLAYWQALPREAPPAHLAFFTVALLPPRAALYAACDGRFDAMMAAGALDEVRTANVAETPLAKALGYPELAAHLAGALTQDEAVTAAKAATRQYAKRQVTWFRHQMQADLVLETPDAAKIIHNAPGFA